MKPAYFPHLNCSTAHKSLQNMVRRQSTRTGTIISSGCCCCCCREGKVHTTYIRSLIDISLTQASGAQSLARSSTPNTVPEAASAESIAADDVLLLQFATAITDIKEFHSRALKLWQDQLCILLMDASASAEDGAIDPKGRSHISMS